MRILHSYLMTTSIICSHMPLEENDRRSIGPLIFIAEYDFCAFEKKNKRTNTCHDLNRNLESDCVFYLNKTFFVEFRLRTTSFQITAWISYNLFFHSMYNFRFPINLRLQIPRRSIRSRVWPFLLHLPWYFGTRLTDLVARGSRFSSRFMLQQRHGATSL